MADENRIKETIETFSFPRLSGTEGEKKALQLAIQKVKELNLTLFTQDFVFSTFFGRMYPKLAFFFGSMTFFLLYLNFVTLIIPVLLIVFGVFLCVLFILTMHPEAIRLPNKLNSSNLYVKVGNKPNNTKSNKIPEKNILFMCHLDSKGQRFSILYRIRIIRTWVFSGMIVAMILVLKNLVFFLFPVLFYIIGIIPIGLNLGSMILFLLNSTNNNSIGAIDNASGIACVFEILSHFSNPEFRLKHYNIFFVFTGAEECGTMGIRNFYQLVKDFDKEETIIFNFDSIAKNTYLFPDKNSSDQVKTVFRMLTNKKNDLIIKRNPKKLPFGSHSDGYYLKKKGFHGIGFGDLECEEYIHSVNDTVDKVDISLLKRLCETIIDNLIAFDDQIKNN
ncbi:MAG: M20/M25/M40 family metallo-hydrolase [Candidatus Lokiarchaeota archaeon]|nr:M20/M25/M40 family metallo-hydrolase [Candidatus Lokiarchaeota archaeon]